MHILKSIKIRVRSSKLGVQYQHYLSERQVEYGFSDSCILLSVEVFGDIMPNVKHFPQSLHGRADIWQVNLFESLYTMKKHYQQGMQVFNDC